MPEKSVAQKGRVKPDTVWAVAERLDMRPLGIVGVDDVWSAFRLRK